MEIIKGIAAGTPPLTVAKSHYAVVGGLVFTAGMGPQDPATGAVAPGIEAQTRQAVANLEAVLAAAGVGLDAVVKTTVHLSHLGRDFAGFDRAYGECFSRPYPVRTTVGSDLTGILVEIDAVAAAPGAGT